MVRYIFNASCARICGKFTPTLTRGKCYVILDGEVIEIDRKKKYNLVEGKLNEAIEDNWFAL